MRVERSIVVERPPTEVFGLVGDPDRVPEFFAGVTRWESASAKRRGPGARFRVRMKVGSIEAGGEIRITKWQQGRTIGWESVRGLPQRGAWRLRRVSRGTEVRLELSSEVSGGPLGWVADRLAARIVGRNLAATLLAVRRILEAEEASRTR
jgi:uncharacterized membrane protein